MLYYEQGTPSKAFGRDEIKKALFETFDRLGPRKKVLAIQIGRASCRERV